MVEMIEQVRAAPRPAATSGGRGDLSIVHRDRSEPPLPHVTRAPRAGVDIAGIAPVEVAEGAPQPVLVGGHDDGMDMIGHQAIGPDLGMRPLRRLREEIEVERIIRVLEEGRLAAVAALGHGCGRPEMTRRGRRAIDHPGGQDLGVKLTVTVTN